MEILKEKIIKHIESLTYQQCQVLEEPNRKYTPAKVCNIFQAHPLQQNQYRKSHKSLQP